MTPELKAKCRNCWVEAGYRPKSEDGGHTLYMRECTVCGVKTAVWPAKHWVNSQIELDLIDMLDKRSEP